jgi:hypothetical protein
MQKTGYSMFPSETPHPFFQNAPLLNRSNTIKPILLTYLGRCVKAKFDPARAQSVKWPITGCSGVEQMPTQGFPGTSAANA